MSADVMQPVNDARKVLQDVTEKAVQSLLKRRDAIDEQLRELGNGKRGRKPKEPGK
jgi:hypothetical protein